MSVREVLLRPNVPFLSTRLNLVYTFNPRAHALPILLRHRDLKVNGRRFHVFGHKQCICKLWRERWRIAVAGEFILGIWSILCDLLCVVLQFEIVMFVMRSVRTLVALLASNAPLLPVRIDRFAVGVPKVLIIRRHRVYRLKPRVTISYHLLSFSHLLPFVPT